MAFSVKSIYQNQNLNDNEKEALISLVEQLFRCYSDALINVTLFGSKARGDFTEESDLDLLIVIKMSKTDYWQHWFSVVDLVGRIELKFGIVTSIIIKDELEYHKMIDDSIFLYTNIEKEGIPLWTKPLSASISISG